MNLTDIPAISIGISIIICWSLFAMFCSFIHETMVQIKAERGRFMKFYLLHQLNDTLNDMNWGNAIYQQGVISGLSRDIRKPTNDISPELFSNALIAAVSESHLVRTQEQALERQRDLHEDLHTPEDQRVKETAAQLLTEIRPYKNPVLNHFHAALILLKPSQTLSLFKSAFGSAKIEATAAEGTVDEKMLYERLNEQLQKWYLELTQRMSLWYQKRTRVRLFRVGVLLALILNVDSVQLFSLFNKNEVSREVVMHYYDQQRDQIPKKDSAEFRKDMDSLIKSAYLPVGLQYNIFSICPRPSWQQILLKIMGALLSGLAASFGAPFWFDLLKKIYRPKSNS